MKPVIINQRWELIVPDHVADWDALQSWERVRFADMEDRLRPGMTLWDVGAEHGELSAVYASFVGAENMVLIEPTFQMWANIRRIWEANDLKMPAACVHALLDEQTVKGEIRSIYKNGEWPAEDLPEQDARAYSYIHDPGTSRGLAHWRIDQLAWSVPRPHALTIDVEGAEVRVVKGANVVLREFRPIVWVSVHPELMRLNYNTEPDHLLSFMRSHGYSAQFLGEDHEQHWVFLP